VSLRFVADENIRGRLVEAVKRHNDTGKPFIDLTAVGDRPDLPRGTRDPALLIWAEREDRILLTRDVSTMSAHLAEHLAAGHTSPGVLVLRDGFSLTQVVEFLELIAYLGDPGEYAGQINYFP
jgi:hypothetical protein